MLQVFVLTLALLSLALLLGASAYESVVMAPNFQRDLPRSLHIAQDFLQRPTPAGFFRPLAPLSQLLLLASVVTCWSLPALRWASVTAFAAIVLVDVITFSYHYPRLRIMFHVPPIEDPAILGKAAREWAAGNLVRVALMLIAFLATLHVLTSVRVGLTS